MRIARAIASGLVFLVALTVGLLAGEAAVRRVLNPADYLSATTVRDEILGIRVAAGTAGFDAWGFRNRQVPARAEIVTIGDSHTYGNNAAMIDSWPSVVGRATGRTVYNLSLGGYGPNQYFHLLETRAVRLKPRWVVCGLYLGDDFENAYRMTYGHGHWAFLRSGHADGVKADIWETEDATRWHQRLRAWLSRNSVIYRLALHGPALGTLKGALQISRVDQRDARTTSLTVPDAGIQEAFRPTAMRDRLDQKSGAVLEGMRITFALLTRMDETCREHGCQLVVALIPTKETVFSEYLLRNPGMHLGDAIADVVKHEAEARARTLQFLARAGIPYVDTLPALKRRVADGLYTRSDRDMHPGRNGYRMIGEAVAQFLGAIRDQRHPLSIHRGETRAGG